MKWTCLALAALSPLVCPSLAPAAPLPIYPFSFSDAITGDNEFIGPDGKHYWFINGDNPLLRADVYAEDIYERPTAQNYEMVQVVSAVGNDPELLAAVGGPAFAFSATGFSDPAYFEYLDIVRGRFGFDSQYLYFAIELFGDEKVGNGGTHTVDFGESSRHRIRISGDPNGKGGVMLSAENPKDLTGTFRAKETAAFFDDNGDVGGPGGILVTNENPGSMNGFEDKIVSDGKANVGAQPELLFARRTTSVTGNPLVEIALDYVAFNSLYPDAAINGIQYLEFEANRGTKDEKNYLWNDKYTLDEAGSPYTPLNEPQNVYELDTLRAGISIFQVPEPSTIFGLGLGGLVVIASRVLRRLRTA